MTNKRWFIWLSVIAFAIVHTNSRREIWILEQRKQANIDPWGLKLSAIGNLFTGLLIIVVPTVIVMLTTPRMLPDITIAGESLHVFINFVTTYAFGVIAARRAVKWWKNNLEI